MDEALGPAHPDTLTARNNLAASLWNLGELDEALRMQLEVVEHRQRVLGSTHPDTLTSKSNLASFLRRSGRVEDSIALQSEVLEARRRVLGPDHPVTLMSESSLASAYADAGRTTESLTLLAHVLESRLRSEALGSDTIRAAVRLAQGIVVAGASPDLKPINRMLLADDDAPYLDKDEAERLRTDILCLIEMARSMDLSAAPAREGGARS